tara:strand:- start:5946 stop:7373 length:1428 start_codon:yes stop_codon:yes gene_type:complete
MAIPMFDPRIAELDKKQAELLEQALQLGATPEMLNTVLRGAVSPNYTLPTAIAQNVPVGSEFDVDSNTPSSGMADAVSYLSNLRAPSYNPYLFNGVTRPTSDATKQVDIRNRNARIQNQNQSMLNAADTIGSLFNGGGRTAENTKGTTAEQGLVLSNLLPLLKGRAPSYVVGGSSGVQDIRDAGITENQIKSQESINKDKSDIIDELKKGTITAPAGQRKLDVVQERQDRLDRGVKSQGNKSIKFDEDRKKLLEDLGEDATEVQKRIDNPNAPSVPTTELPEDINTDATVTIPEEGDGTSPEGAEDKQNWFDAINDRVDLMAMGAAMLASSGQAGANTLSRLGSGLQAGIASRAGQAKAIQDKQYKDALLLLRAQQARAAGITDPLKNYGAKISDISSFMAGSGFEGDNLTELSRLIHGVDTNFVSYPAATKKAIADEMAKQGSNWFSSGGELSTTDVGETYLEARKVVAQRLAK